MQLLLSLPRLVRHLTYISKKRASPIRLQDLIFFPRVHICYLYIIIIVVPMKPDMHPAGGRWQGHCKCVTGVPRRSLKRSVYRQRRPFACAVRGISTLLLAVFGHILHPPYVGTIVRVEYMRPPACLLVPPFLLAGWVGIQIDRETHSNSYYTIGFWGGRGKRGA